MSEKSPVEKNLRHLYEEVLPGAELDDAVIERVHGLRRHEREAAVARVPVTRRAVLVGAAGCARRGGARPGSARPPGPW